MKRRILTLLDAYDNIKSGNKNLSVGFYDAGGEEQYGVKRLYKVDKK